MFFDRDQNARRQREIAYRNQLKGEIELKNSKIFQKNQRSSSNKPETFSLLKNIEAEQENRKKRQQNFYSELQSQIEFEKQQKKRKKEEQARRELQEEERIKKDMEMLRQRAEIQKIQEQKKKGPPKKQDNNDFANKKLNQSIQNGKNPKRINPLPSLNNHNLQQSFHQQQQNTNSQNYYSRLKTSQSQRDQQLPLQTFQSTNQKRPPYSMNSMPTYVNRVQNEAFNFLPQRKYMDSYFQELLGEKRKFQQEAASVSELNRILYQEKSKAGKIQSRGLGELKKLQNMLDQKGANYMAGFTNSRSSNQFDSLRKLSIPTFQSSRVAPNNTGWRKLD